MGRGEMGSIGDLLSSWRLILTRLLVDRSLAGDVSALQANEVCRDRL